MNFNYEQFLEKYGLSTFALKLFACVIMLIDHIGAILLPNVIMLRIIGRLSFPIFCFLIVQGYIHTRDVKKYFIRLVLFALISEIPYDLAFFGRVNFGQQNVFFTLALGLFVIIVIDRANKIVSYIAFILACALAYILKTDYDLFGVLLIMMLYLVRGKKILEAITVFATNVGLCVGIQRYASIAMFPIALYNGKKGPSLKYFFYIFYPVHLLILYLIRCII